MNDNIEDELTEMSAMGAGAIQGAGIKQMDRETFLEELKLRKYVREAIRVHKKDALQQKKKTLHEEVKLRSIIQKLILESEEDRPHHSTGINVLSDLLKKVVPVLEIDYKKMTSKPEQRQSFRAHILKACQNVMETEKVDDEAGDGQSSNGAVMHEDGGEAEINLDVTPEEPVDPEAEKFIDIERPSQKKSKEVEVDPADAFKIDGEDETGRNIAMSCFQKVEKGIIDSYAILSDPDDKRLFYDYLITNLKLYFERFETELDNNIKEPVSASDQQSGIKNV